MGYTPRFIDLKTFQFYLSSIKSKSQILANIDGQVFQFYLSSIKSR